MSERWRRSVLEAGPSAASAPWGRLAALVACVACATPGEPPDCLEQRQQARNLALSGELTRAEELLDGVKARCGPNSQSDIRHITKLIAEKRVAERERELREASRKAALREAPTRSFVEWATSRAGDVAGKLPAVTCAERGTPLFGSCEGRRPEAPNMSVRYWQQQPNAYLYSLSTDATPTCQDLGSYRVVRNWRRGAAELELCELTERRLRHLSALIVHAPPAHEMHIFSQDYLGLDPAFEQRLRVVEAR